METPKSELELQETAQLREMTLRMLQEIHEERRKTWQEARAAIETSGEKMPLLLTTWEELFAEMTRRAKERGRITVRPEDL